MTFLHRPDDIVQDEPRFAREYVAGLVFCIAAFALAIVLYIVG